MSLYISFERVEYRCFTAKRKTSVLKGGEDERDREKKKRKKEKKRESQC